MENILYNDLIRRGFDVDVGVVEYNTRDEDDKKIRKQLEVDFVINRGNQRYYIQSALTIDDPDKRRQETESLIRIPDFFKKIVVVKDNIEPWRDDIKRQHLRRSGWWKGAHQQTKSDRVPHRAGCRAESYDSTDEKTTCGVQAGRKVIKSKGMVSKCA